MTDAVNRVSAAKELERKSRQGGVVKRGTPKHHSEHDGDDCVDISQEARERASGKEGRK